MVLRSEAKEGWSQQASCVEEQGTTRDDSLALLLPNRGEMTCNVDLSPLDGLAKNHEKVLRLARVTQQSTPAQRVAWERALGENDGPEQSIVTEVIAAYLLLTSCVDTFACATQTMLSQRAAEVQRLLRTKEALEAQKAANIAAEAQLDAAVMTACAENAAGERSIQQYLISKRVRTRLQTLSKNRARAAVAIQCMLRRIIAMQKLANALDRRNVEHASAARAAIVLQARARGILVRVPLSARASQLQKEHLAAKLIQANWRRTSCRRFWMIAKDATSSTTQALAAIATTLTTDLVTAARSLRLTLAFLPPCALHAKILMDLSSELFDNLEREFQFMRSFSGDSPLVGPVSKSVLNEAANRRRSLLTKFFKVLLRVANLLARHNFAHIIMPSRDPEV